MARGSGFVMSDRVAFDVVKGCCEYGFVSELRLPRGDQ